VSYHSTGPTLRGLAEPGHTALLSLLQATVSVLMISPELPAPRDMLACKVLMQMVDEAGEEFARAEAAVDQAFPSGDATTR
jgi:hypothetical protein